MAELVLELERTVRAPAAATFTAFTDPHQLADWWGPQGFTTRAVEWDPRPGASYRLEMTPPDSDPFHLCGEFRGVDPPLRLAFPFAWEPPDPDDVETLATLRFHDLAGSTRVQLVQGPFKTDDRLAVHRDGWGDSLDRLAALLG
jgi:uncharacterized protein YndB with AHSA1/START domain